MRPLRSTTHTRPNDRAVSSVISIVLLVAVTIVLTTVIGTYALGITDETSENVPSASFEVVREDVDFAGATYNIVFLQHEYGDKLDAKNLQVRVNGKQAWDVAGMDDGSGRTVKPTDGAGTLQSGSRLRLVYWPNVYTNHPIPDGDLYKTNSGGCGAVLTTSDTGDCELNDDIVGREESATIKVIYESPKTGETVTLDTLEVSARI